MLNLVLEVAKFVFLVVLYLFVYMVVRSVTKELWAVAPVRDAAAPRPVASEWAGAGQPGGVATSPAGRASLKPEVESGSGLGWALHAEESRQVGGQKFGVHYGTHMLVGRATDAEIHLPDTFVSSHHARVEARLDGLEVEDLGSTNGTFVNGREIEGSVLLRPGDKLAIGDTVFRVEAW